MKIITKSKLGYERRTKIPLEICKLIGLKRGDILVYLLNDSGEIVIKNSLLKDKKERNL